MLAWGPWHRLCHQCWLHQIQCYMHEPHCNCCALCVHLRILEPTCTRTHTFVTSVTCVGSINSPHVTCIQWTHMQSYALCVHLPILDHTHTHTHTHRIHPQGWMESAPEGPVCATSPGEAPAAVCCSKFQGLVRELIFDYFLDFCSRFLLLPLTSGVLLKRSSFSGTQVAIDKMLDLMLNTVWPSNQSTWKSINWVCEFLWRNYRYKMNQPVSAKNLYPLNDTDAPKVPQTRNIFNSLNLQLNLQLLSSLWI